MPCKAFGVPKANPPRRKARLRPATNRHCMAMYSMYTSGDATTYAVCPRGHTQTVTATALQGAMPRRDSGKLVGKRRQPAMSCMCAPLATMNARTVVVGSRGRGQQTVRLEAGKWQRNWRLQWTNATCIKTRANVPRYYCNTHYFTRIQKLAHAHASKRYVSLRVARPLPSASWL